MKKKAYLVSCFNYYENRLKYWDNFLHNKGYDVIYITSDFDHIGKKHFNLDVNNAIQIKTVGYQNNISIKRIVSHMVFSYKTYKFIKNQDIDFLYIMVPPNILLYKLSKLKKRRHFKLVVDIYDLWPETFPSKPNPLIKLVFNSWKKMRDMSFSQTDFIITECNLYQKVLSKQLESKKKSTLYLCSDKENNGEIKKISNTELHLCYLGSINNIINQDLIIEFLEKMNNKKKTILHIIGTGETKKKLLESLIIKEIPFQDHGVIFDSVEKEKILNECHFGINLMKEEVVVGLTMKSIDYFSHSLPIINNIKDDTQKLVKEYRIGYNLENKLLDEIVNKISKLTSEELYNYKKNTQKMFNQLFSKESMKNSLERIYCEIEMSDSGE